MKDLVYFGVGLVLGIPFGAILWHRYKAKAAADLAKVAGDIGK